MGDKDKECTTLIQLHKIVISHALKDYYLLFKIYPRTFIFVFAFSQF